MKLLLEELKDLFDEREELNLDPSEIRDVELAIVVSENNRREILNFLYGQTYCEALFNLLEWGKDR
ncbi:hypothetical protein [Halalkalibacter flavus]|uniref:hypothetical protein n=1 Tax=Halalkalibacter flavus TaxID=3090668 RepID=UPI002FC99A8C